MGFRRSITDRDAKGSTALLRAGKSGRSLGIKCYPDKRGYVRIKGRRRGATVSEFLGEQIGEALDPTKQHGPVTEVVESSDVVQELKEETVFVKYLKVLKRTEAAVYVSFGCCRRWLPTSQIKFIEGCLIELPKWLVLKRGLHRF